MKKSTISLSLLLLHGCMTTDTLGTYGVSEVNVENLNFISKGMDEAQVRQLMRSPYSEETIQLNNDQYDIWYYVTNPTLLGQARMVHYNLTPLTFKNDILVSIGWDYYRSLSKCRDNLMNMNRIQLNMTQAQVRFAMQTPEKENSFFYQKSQYDILFYRISPTGSCTACEENSDLVPLAFKDNKLISIDCDQYAKLQIDLNLAQPIVPGREDSRSFEEIFKPDIPIQSLDPASIRETESDNTESDNTKDSNFSSELIEEPAAPPSSAPKIQSNVESIDEAPLILDKKTSTTIPEKTSQNSAVIFAEQPVENGEEEEEEEPETTSDDVGIDLTQENDELLQRDNDLNFDQF